MSNTETVRTMMNAYRAKDLATAERLLSDDFVFTSPQDDHIDKAAFLQRCFPTADRFVSNTTLHLVDAADDGVFLMYEYELPSGDRHRNTEFITVHDGKLVETQVFFGGRVR